MCPESGVTYPSGRTPLEHLPRDSGVTESGSKTCEASALASGARRGSSGGTDAPVSVEPRHGDARVGSAPGADWSLIDSWTLSGMENCPEIQNGLRNERAGVRSSSATFETVAPFSTRRWDPPDGTRLEVDIRLASSRLSLRPCLHSFCAQPRRAPSAPARLISSR